VIRHVRRIRRRQLDAARLIDRRQRDVFEFATVENALQHVPLALQRRPIDPVRHAGCTESEVPSIDCNGGAEIQREPSTVLRHVPIDFYGNGRGAKCEEAGRIGVEPHREVKIVVAETAEMVVIRRDVDALSVAGAGTSRECELRAIPAGDGKRELVGGFVGNAEGRVGYVTILFGVEHVEQCGVERGLRAHGEIRSGTSINALEEAVARATHDERLAPVGGSEPFGNHAAGGPEPAVPVQVSADPCIHDVSDE
jgi:hypothetical protein